MDAPIIWTDVRSRRRNQTLHAAIWFKVISPQIPDLRSLKIAPSRPVLQRCERHDRLENSVDAWEESFCKDRDPLTWRTKIWTNTFLGAMQSLWQRGHRSDWQAGLQHQTPGLDEGFEGIR